MKLAVIADSKTGNTKQAADWIVQGMNRVENTEAKAFIHHIIAIITPRIIPIQNETTK